MLSVNYLDDQKLTKRFSRGYDGDLFSAEIFQDLFAEFDNIERLRKVSICAESKAPLTFQMLTPRGNDDDRQIGRAHV
jgi:hypothetical protein